MDTLFHHVSNVRLFVGSFELPDPLLADMTCKPRLSVTRQQSGARQKLRAKCAVALGNPAIVKLGIPCSTNELETLW